MGHYGYQRRGSGLAGASSVLTQLLSLIGGDSGGDLGPESPQFVIHHWAVELSLFGASVMLSAVLMITFLPATWIGEQLAGAAGRKAGVDVGLGCTMFGLSGLLLHMARYYVIRVYARRAVGSWGRLDAALHAPVPAMRARWIMTSTGWDFALQLLCSLVTVVVALRLDP